MKLTRLQQNQAQLLWDEIKSLPMEDARIRLAQVHGSVLSTGEFFCWLLASLTVVPLNAVTTFSDHGCRFNHGESNHSYICIYGRGLQCIVGRRVELIGKTFYEQFHHATRELHRFEKKRIRAELKDLQRYGLSVGAIRKATWEARQ